MLGEVRCFIVRNFFWYEKKSEGNSKFLFKVSEKLGRHIHKHTRTIFGPGTNCLEYSHYFIPV